MMRRHTQDSTSAQRSGAHSDCTFGGRPTGASGGAASLGKTAAVRICASFGASAGSDALVVATAAAAHACAVRLGSAKDRYAAPLLPPNLLRVYRSDAAFAALETEAPVIEGMGLEGFGAHSNNAEYVELASIEPRLYLLTRLIIDVAKGETGVLE